MNYRINKNGQTLLESVYNNRDLTKEYIDELLNSTTWEDTLNYKNMDRGCELLDKVIAEGGEIGIVIDPDVDGYMSGAIIYSWIYDYLGYDNVYYMIKNQSKKSHGIDKEIIRKVDNNDMALIILPDGGAGDFEYQEELYNMGCEVLVLDHHEFDTTRETKAVIINNQDGVVENTKLSGTGVTYKFVFHHAELKEIDLGTTYLDLVAVSLISDMCDMTSMENRYIFSVGSQVSNISNELLTEFVKDLKVKRKLSIENIAFGVANKMNSIIRLGDEERFDMFESLIGSEEQVSYKYKGKEYQQSIQASILRVANRLKQKQKKMVEKCIGSGLDIITNENDRILIVNGMDIDSEIRGLLANKLLSEYGKPVMILKEYNGVLRGSCRGVNSISFKDLLEKSGMFNYVEGHQNSFGCSINKDKVDELIGYVNKELLGVDLSSSTDVDYVYEGNIPLSDVIALGELDDLWCNQIKRPKILVKNMKINSNDIYKKGIDMNFKLGGVLFKRDFCSKVFYEDLVCFENNSNIDKDLNINMICEVKSFENGRSYINIVEFESCLDN